MGTFAVLREHDQPEYEVHACHLNLWSLSGFLGRRVIFFDVGLKFTPTHEGLTRIQLLIPFTVDERPRDAKIRGPETAQNLKGRISNDEAGRLVFGEPVTMLGAGQMKLAGGDEFALANVTSFEKDSRSTHELDQAGMSVWTCHVDRVRAGQAAYMRVRFRATSGGRTWVWGRSKRTAVVDLRVSELRENVGTSRPELVESLGARFVRIAKLNALVIAPSWLELRVASPETHYVRLFEGRVWEGYLGRSADLRHSDKLLVYHWRHNAEIKADGTDPFRAFMALAAEPRWPGWLAPVATAVFAAFLVATLIPGQTVLPALTLPQVTLAAALPFAVAVIERVRSNASFLVSLPTAARRFLLGVEDAAYRWVSR